MNAPKTIDAALVRALLARILECKGSLGLCWTCKAALTTHQLITFAKRGKRGWDGEASHACEACARAAVKATARRTMPSKMIEDNSYAALRAVLAALESA